MPDSFFERKRKRPSSKSGPRPSGSAPKAARANGKAAARPSSARRGGGSEEEEGEDDEDEGAGAADAMDLRHEYEASVRSEDEDALETPAEARVRLARLYVDGMRRQDIGESYLLLASQVTTLLTPT